MIKLSDVGDDSGSKATVSPMMIAPGGGDGDGNGGGTYVPSPFFYAVTNDGRGISSKYLEDDYGNKIIDPNTGDGYVVPYYFNIHDVISEFNGLKQNYEIAQQSGDPTYAAGVLASNLLQLGREFMPTLPGAKWDLQRTYNGLHATDSGGFVPAYTDAANYLFSIAANAMGVPEDQALKLAGALNYAESWISSRPVDTSAPYYNKAVNWPNLLKGYADLTGTTLSSVDAPDYVSNDTTVYDGQTWQSQTSHWNSDTPDEVAVQKSQNLTTGDQTVSIQTDTWGVTFSAGGNSNYWNNAAGDQPPPGTDPLDDHEDSYRSNFTGTVVSEGSTTEVPAFKAVQGTQLKSTDQNPASPSQANLISGVHGLVSSMAQFSVASSANAVPLSLPSEPLHPLIATALR